MSQSRLTGSRVRERRLFLGQKQSALAAAVGISAAYLNLIEHNRRRVGGALLHDLARELKTEPHLLTEGAEAALLGVLREAGQRLPGSQPELHRSEDLAGRFPGWAGLVAAQHQRVRELEQRVEALSDRLTHDPELAASLHEVISAVTAIRSTVGILSDDGNIAPDLQTRFLKNMRDEGRRLSGAAQGLVEYLDGGDDRDAMPVAPGEELSAFLEGRQHHLVELEGLNPRDPAGAERRIGDLVAAVGGVQTAGVRDVVARFFTTYAQDAMAMPLDEFAAARHALGDDPGRLAEHFGQSVISVMRRMAFVPDQDGQTPFGLVSCDGSGSLVLRKSLAGFALPRFGAACPYWPLYQSLGRPGQPVRAVVELPGPAQRRFLCQAICLPQGRVRFDRPAVVEAVMLMSLQDKDKMPVSEGDVLPVGSSCRVCPRLGCEARREASVVISAP